MSTLRDHRIALLLGTAFLLTACGTAQQAVAPRVSTAAAITVKTATLPALDGSLTANRVLTFAHTAARQMDGKAAFIGLSGTKIGVEGVPMPGGTWIVQYVGEELEAPNKFHRNDFDKWTRRITVTVSDQGVPTLKVTEEPSMPFGVSYMDSPIPELDSMDVVRIMRKERPASPAYPIARMSLAGHPRDYQMLLWKVVGVGQQNDARSFTIDAHTGAVISQSQ